MIDPVHKRLLAENAWLKQQIAQLKEEHESDIKHTPEDMARHNEIVDKVARHHGTMHPHMTTHISGGGPPDIEKSIEDLKQNLGKYRNPKFNKVFKSVDDALNHMEDTHDFAPYHLTQPNGYIHPKDDRYSEMLVGVGNSIHNEEQDKKKKK